jgi:hypothetical protein
VGRNIVLHEMPFMFVGLQSFYQKRMSELILQNVWILLVRQKDGPVILLALIATVHWPEPTRDLWLIFPEAAASLPPSGFKAVGLMIN